MKILVLGGTGAMGKHLAAQLDRDGTHVTVTSRKILSSNSINYVHGNAKDMAFLQQLLQEKWDAIVDFMIYENEEFKERLDLFLNSTNQYVFLSSSRVYANSNTPITEESDRLIDTCRDEKYLATNEYALSKARQENLLFKSNNKNWTIIRPYITYSEERLQLGVFEKEGWLYRAMKGRKIVFSKDLNNKLTTLTYGLDVAVGIKAIIGNQAALGQSFHITSEKSVTWGEVLNLYLTELRTHLGYTPKVLLVDIDDSKNFHRAKYQIDYDRLYDREFDNKKIGQHVNLSHFKELETGLSECIRHFLQNPDFKKINWKAEALKDRQTNERTPLREIPSAKQKVKYILSRYLPSQNL